MTDQEKECMVINSEFNNKTAIHGIQTEKSYEVKGWYMDSNGCLKTYGDGYSESFISETEYS